MASEQPIDPCAVPSNAESPGGSERGVRKLAKPFVLLISLALSLTVVELGLRLFFPGDFKPPADDRSPHYPYDPVLGWLPRPDSTSTFAGSRTITVSNNSQGFRGPEPVIGQQPGLMVLGDSFVWGYDVEASERFTEKLQARHPEWAVYNLGVSGYATDQEYLLLQRYFEVFKPRVVLLVFCSDNDEEDNRWNFRYGGYKPYYSVDGQRLNLEGVPVPRSERAWLGSHPRVGRLRVVRLLVRWYCRLTTPGPVRHADTTLPLLEAMDRYVRDRGARFVVGMQAERPRIARGLDALQIPRVDLETTNRYPDVYYGRHWNPAGHEFVCEAIDHFLTAGKYLEPVPPGP